MTTLREEHEWQVEMMQKVFKNKMAALKNFTLPYQMTANDLQTEINENFSTALILFTNIKLVEGFKVKKTKNEIMKFVRAAIADKEKGRWMCMFMDDVHAFSAETFRYLKVSFTRDDQKYWIIVAQTELKEGK